MMLNKILRFALLILYLGIGNQHTVFGQNLQAELFVRDHSISRDIPQNLQSSRSVAIIVTSFDGNWKKIADEVHPYFKKMSIDVVGYFNARDLFSGTDPTLGFINQLSARQVKNVIFIIPSEINNGQSEVIIAPFEGHFDTKSEKQRKAWGAVGLEFSNVFKLLANDVINAELELQNFLIMDKPTFYEDAAIVKGTKFDVHSRDLRAVKLAIPKFQKIESTSKLVNQYNKSIELRNDRLEELMSIYPYEYGFVESIDEKELYREGYQYVLLNIQTTGLNIKRMLNMQINPGETEFVSLNAKTKTDVSLERYSYEEVVYKYYVKHLLTGDIYIGDKWDSSITWDQSLNNYLNNLILFIKR